MSLPNNNYSESAMVEKPAIELFKNLGWEFVDCYGEFDSGKSFLDRETKSDVVLISRLKPAIKKLNPNVSDDFINEAINIIIADRNLMGMAYANKEVYQLIKDGVVVECLNNKNESVSERLKIIDWDNPENNDFLLASQFWVSGDIYTRRADLVGFVNGIPLLFIELKAFSKNIKEAYDK
ncbi:MAG TPA: type I restriction endonuclease [Elusimicrobiales bacterium]|nr:type I restriction endonuclease [Elusimicrobiales bacterium]